MAMQDFIWAINDLATEVHQNAVNHGFYEEVPSIPERLMLIVSEVAEALEEYRDGMPTQYITRLEPLALEERLVPVRHDNPDDWFPGEKPEGLAVELADAVIRILDTCAEQGIDIGTLIVKKHEYNKTRPYRHGGKVL